MAIAITILGLIILALCFLVAVVLGIGAAMGDEAMDKAIQAKRDLNAEQAAADEAAVKWRNFP